MIYRITSYSINAFLTINFSGEWTSCYLRCRKDNGLPFEETLLYLRMESGDPTVLGSKWNNSLYVAAGKDPFILIEKAVAAAAQLSGGAQQRQDKRQPDSLNWFGWCTWDAYYSKVSARGILVHVQHSSPTQSCQKLSQIALCMHICSHA